MKRTLENEIHNMRYGVPSCGTFFTKLISSSYNETN